MSFEIEQPPKKTNWFLWIVLIGGLLLVVPIACCGGITLLGFNAVKAPLIAAGEALSEDPRVTEQLGTPVTHDSISMTNYQNDNGNGYAEINTSFSGPNGTAQVEGKMDLVGGEWQVGNLKVRLPDGSEVELP